jgi:hypothetical protein
MRTPVVLDVEAVLRSRLQLLGVPAARRRQPAGKTPQRRQLGPERMVHGAGLEGELRAHALQRIVAEISGDGDALDPEDDDTMPKSGPIST